ncbi:cytochrome b5-like heme/steroid binding domain-containing protein [Crepidotus variabilis]|uniref:Cytochrome b5-like heme/steroid binding domain-containing protein n=1 Tax=Crepidotus variabilis TaxID=179855 RepID=A0A9P6ETD0_9AGAR|nr:cytochrome b5-like heme/steroid binding domain-containing protein [Crepidotus variabilis]
MSWMKDLSGPGEKSKPYKDESTEKVADPNIPNRMVSNKKANRPFLAYKEYRDSQEALHVAWLKKKEAHDAAVARGEKVKPLEPDPTAVQEVGLLGLLKFIVIVVFMFALAGKFLTGSYTWESNSKWLQAKTYIPKGGGQRLFSQEGLATFNGEDGRPIYLAIDGDVYDVSKGKAYQPGGSYHHFAGVDAARAFGTGCFATHKTHDLRGLTDAEYAGVQHWKQFYANHKDYVKIGKVLHPPLDYDSPIPQHCNPPKPKSPSKDAQKDSKTDHKEL